MSTEAPLTAWDPAGPETPRPDLKVAGIALAEPAAGLGAQPFEAPVEELQFRPVPTAQPAPGGLFKIGSVVALVAVIGMSVFAVITDDGGKKDAKPAPTVAPASNAPVPNTQSGTKKLSPAQQRKLLEDKASQKARQAPPRRLIPKTAAAGADPLEISEGAGPPVAPGTAQAVAKKMMTSYGWKPAEEFGCLYQLWSRESGWRTTAGRPDGPYGLPQANPGTKMASAGPKWRTDATTQIKWGFGYIKARYQTPCKAWAAFQSQHWY